MLISLSGNGTVAPNFWVNWTNGVNYNVGVQTPQYRIDSLDALLRTPDFGGHQRGQLRTTPGSQGGRLRPGTASVGASPSGASQAYGNPGAHGRQHAAALEPGHRRTRLHARSS